MQLTSIARSHIKLRSKSVELVALYTIRTKFRVQEPLDSANLLRVQSSTLGDRTSLTTCG